jgi:hypothetical protein
MKAEQNQRWLSHNQTSRRDLDMCFLHLPMASASLPGTLLSGLGIFESELYRSVSLSVISVGTKHHRAWISIAVW